MKYIACSTLALIAVANGFAPPAAQTRCTNTRMMASVEERAKNANNPKDKASRFRVNSSEEGKTAVRAYRDLGSKTSTGGKGLFGMFNGSSKNPEEKSGDTSVKGVKPNVRNPTEKASRFRVDQPREEGKTAIRAFNPPSPSKGPASTSKAGWTIPSKYLSGDTGRSGESLQSRADQYMKGAISARDFAATLRSRKLDSVAPDIIGSMPEGQKRSNLFKMFTQL